MQGYARIRGFGGMTTPCVTLCLGFGGVYTSLAGYRLGFCMVPIFYQVFTTYPTCGREFAWRSMLQETNKATYRRVIVSSSSQLQNLHPEPQARNLRRRPGAPSLNASSLKPQSYNSFSNPCREIYPCHNLRIHWLIEVKQYLRKEPAQKLQYIHPQPCQALLPQLRSSNPIPTQCKHCSRTWAEVW